MISLGLNLLLAVVWLLLSKEPTPGVFAVGMLMGFALLAAFPTLLASRDYVRRTLAGLRFLLVFLREFVMANFTVAWTILFRPRTSLHPNFLTYDVAGLNPGEILLLSYCISLTPGTTTVNVSDDFQFLVLHALDADDPARIRENLDRVLKHGILAFTR
jgi:multisubunit Na+/H+ antiporter MnhE subunit